MNKPKYYYDITDDIEMYNAWCFIIFGGRATGKTYSTLKYHVENNMKFVFIKREIDDVTILCSGATINKPVKDSKYTLDMSPFKSLNRDMGWNIKPFQIFKGIGAFFHCDTEEGLPIGEPVGYIFALAAVAKYRGFDLSECDSMIFDEFVPKEYERKRRGEGKQVLDLYKTVCRDREHRGLKPLNLICLANPDEISSPVVNILEVLDDIAYMAIKDELYHFIDKRGILLHRVLNNEEFMERERNTALMKAMEGTAWADMSLDNKFSYNDFSNIGKESIKGCICVCKVIYNRKEYYVYKNMNNKKIFMTRIKSNRPKRVYDLSRDSECRRFYIDMAIDLKEATIYDLVTYDDYTSYDLILNYKENFKI